MIRPPPTSPLFPTTPLSRSSPPRRVAIVWRSPAARQEQDHDRQAPRAAIAHAYPFSSLLSSLRKRQSVSTVSTLHRCPAAEDRKSTRLNSSHLVISYAVFCL